jgi:hypothetical protein
MPVGAQQYYANQIVWNITGTTPTSFSSNSNSNSNSEHPIVPFSTKIRRMFLEHAIQHEVRNLYFFIFYVC